MSAKTVAALEQGRRRSPRLSTVGELADALSLSPQERAVLSRAAVGGSPPDDPEPGVADAVDRHPDAGRSTGGMAPPLPRPITPLVGREVEAEAVADELASERLVTLVGPGGVGKTRLALRVAAATPGKFPGGTWWVDLAMIGDPDAVPAAVLAAMGSGERPGGTVAEQIIASLPEDSALIILDNCEHVLDASAALIGQLLGSPAVTVLATSRAPLAIPGEVSWPVPPLGVPPDGHPAGTDALRDVESVQLFVERASRSNPSFAFADADAASVARICQRLDGIPLAIELAAVRVRALSPRQLADEVDARISLVAARARGVPDRQATIWSSIDWSYQLLPDDERAVFRSLAGFAGTFAIDAVAAVARQVASVDAQTSVDILTHLVEQSLVAVVGPTGGHGRDP